MANGAATLVVPAMTVAALAVSVSRSVSAGSARSRDGAARAEAHAARSVVRLAAKTPRRRRVDLRAAPRASGSVRRPCPTATRPKSCAAPRASSAITASAARRTRSYARIPNSTGHGAAGRRRTARHLRSSAAARLGHYELRVALKRPRRVALRRALCAHQSTLRHCVRIAARVGSERSIVVPAQRGHLFRMSANAVDCRQNSL